MAVTATVVASAAGQASDARGPLLPAAATMTRSALRARLIASCMSTLGAPATERLATCTSFSASQEIARRSAARLPLSRPARRSKMLAA